MSIQVMIPDEHAARIKALAASRDISAADAVGTLIQIAIEHGHIEPGLPGYKVKRTGDTIIVSHKSGYSRTFNVELARGFATALHWVAMNNAKEKLPSALKDVAFILSGMEEHVGVKRRGSAIKIVDHNKNERTLAPSVAVELSLMVDRIAAE